MKRMSQILYSLALLTLLILSSCGSDNSTGAAPISATNPLTGGQCACNSEEMPVCGINIDGFEKDYSNICMANCFKATNIVQGRCVCSEKLVCMSDGRSLTECNAQAAIRINSSLTITKFYGCKSQPPSW